MLQEGFRGKPYNTREEADFYREENVLLDEKAREAKKVIKETLAEDVDRFRRIKRYLWDLDTSRIESDVATRRSVLVEASAGLGAQQVLPSLADGMNLSQDRMALELVDPDEGALDNKKLLKLSLNVSDNPPIVLEAKLSRRDGVFFIPSDESKKTLDSILRRRDNIESLALVLNKTATNSESPDVHHEEVTEESQPAAGGRRGGRFSLGDAVRRLRQGGANALHDLVVGVDDAASNTADALKGRIEAHLTPAQEQLNKVWGTTLHTLLNTMEETFPDVDPESPLGQRITELRAGLSYGSLATTQEILDLITAEDELAGDDLLPLFGLEGVETHLNVEIDGDGQVITNAPYHPSPECTHILFTPPGKHDGRIALVATYRDTTRAQMLTEQRRAVPEDIARQDGIMLDSLRIMTLPKQKQKSR